MNILVIGDGIVDHYQFGSVNRQSPEDPTISVFDVEKEEYRLGGCMNVAANIKSISCSSRNPIHVVISTIFSQFIGTSLWMKNIQSDIFCASEIYSDSNRPENFEIIKTRVINNNKQLIRIDNRKKFREKDIDYHNDIFTSQLLNYDAVVVSDYCKGLVNETTVSKLKKYKGPIFIDTKNPDLSFWNSLENVVIIKKNEQEWKNSFGKTKHNCVVTKGSSGAWWMIKNGSIVLNDMIFPVERIENAEVTGAGDVFLAGFVVSYMNDKDFSNAIKFANKCAGLSVRQHGTTEVYIND